MDDLGQIIFLVLFILFGLISSSKKKARTKRPRVPAVSPPEVERPLQREASDEAEETARPKSVLAQELLALLQGEAVPADEPEVTISEVDEEAQSIETLEPAGVESHERFHRLYLEKAPTGSASSPSEEPSSHAYDIPKAQAAHPHLVQGKATQRPYGMLARSKRKKHLSRRELQHAFVMKEVLGPPKALE